MDKGKNRDLEDLVVGHEERVVDTKNRLVIPIGMRRGDVYYVRNENCTIYGAVVDFFIVFISEHIRILINSDCPQTIKFEVLKTNACHKPHLSETLLVSDDYQSS